jgi:hypothetical protein
MNTWFPNSRISTPSAPVLATIPLPSRSTSPTLTMMSQSSSSSLYPLSDASTSPPRRVRKRRVIPPALPSSPAQPTRTPRSSSRFHPMQRCTPSSSKTRIRLHLLSALQDMEYQEGEDRVLEELEKLAVQRGVGHLPESCKLCRIDGFSDWIYCKQSRYHVDHPRHVCSMTQECFCKEA